MRQNFCDGKYSPARTLPFMSGGGKNVERILEQEKEMGLQCPYRTVAIVTDDKRSNAFKFGDTFSKPVIYWDIREAQVKEGLGRKLSLQTPALQQFREDYSRKLFESLPDVDFAIFGGFEPLVNLVRDLHALNIHPGDTLYLVDGKPYLVGLHTEPIRRAIEKGIPFVRSSVIMPTPYTGAGLGMDDGPTFGSGPKLFYGDERDLKVIQNKLKFASDLKILPATVLAAARGELEYDPLTNEVFGRVVMDDEVKISDVKLD
jgi:hypothetical protein